ncbi:uncharacterized protein LOC110445929 isoform X3 [Mizuhopecten yessoensis]|uniref:uncharacterized protein LOC110445929 isoform X3 n=1 Tax=Mizuhopecten yessoensis TaxID=6573 RepID=UPI000B457142|nr:uncharacterized protein LOC110445929 isoform X3 [Mizuhopecten yessoensis]
MDESDNIQIESEEGNDDPGYLTTSTAVDIANKMYSTDSDLSDWETRQFGRHKITSPPLIHKNQPSDNEDNVPPESPGKRSYEKTFDTVSFEAAAENVQLSPSKKKHKEQVWTVGKENQERMPKNWNNSVSSRDSALGSSLFSAFGSVLTDSSTSFDSQSNSDDTTSSVNSSPVHSVYGRYQKIYTNDKGKNTSDKALMEYENLLLHRLPGENLGMILGIEGGKFNESISGVFVKTVTIGGAAYRATGSSKGIAVGDEILEVNGMNLKQMNRDECMTVLKEMPLRVNLMLRRGSKFSGPTSSEGVSHFRQKMKEVSSREMKVCKNQRLIQNYAMTTTTSESEDDILEGFALHHVEVDKNPDESLGISIVPSYGSTREFYQVKRLLPSGAAARSTKLKVGDRLVSCNAVSLQNLAQAKCLSILKNEAQHGDLELEVLRQTANDTPMEISVIVANGVGSKQSKVSSSKEQEIYPNSGLESESDNDVVLSGFHFNHDKSNSDRVNQMFAKNVKQQNRVPTRHPPQKYTSESNVSDQDSDYSLKSQHQKLVKAKMASNSSDPWSLALPPPAEFSDDAGLTSEAGASDTGDEHVPTTNIDDILSDYAPSISGSFRVEPYNKGLQLRDVSSGLDRSQERKRGNSLTQIQESSQELELDLSTQNGKENKSSQVKQTNFDEASLEFPDKSMNSYGYDTLREQRQVMDVFDSYLTSEDDSIMSYKQSTSHGAESVEQSNVCVTYNSQNKPRNPPSNQRANGSSRSDGDQAKYELKNVIHGDTNLGKNVVTNLNYDENIVPVQVKREMSTPPNWGKYSKFSKLPASVFDLPESSVDEEVIIPASIERENKVPIYESPMPHLDTSLPREKVPSRPKLQPRKSKSSESEESMEEIVSPIYVKKEQGSRILEEKLGTDIEETFIIPEEAKRENAWRAVQLVLMTDKWTKASKSCDGQEGEGGVLNVLSDIKSEKIETNISSTEASSVTGLSTNQLSTSVSSSGELSVIAVDNKSTSVSGELSVTAVDNKSTSVSGENVGVTVTPVNNQQKSRPVSGENIINVSVEKIHDWQSLEKNSRQKEHMITSRIEELTDENEEENVSIILEENLTKTDRGMSERNLTDPQPTHKTIVCIAEDNNVNNFVNIDCDPNQPLPHENTVTLKNAVLIDTNPCGGQSLMPQSVSVSLTSPLVSPLALTHSPTMKSGTDSTPSKSPVPRSPVPRSRKGIYPDRKSPSSPPRAASPAVMLSMDTSKESESSTTEINVTKSPSVSPKSPGSVLSPTSISSCASQMSEGDKQAKPVKKEDPPEESAPKQSTKYTTSVAVTKPSLLSTIRSQKTKTSGNMKPLSSIKPLKITTNFQPKPVKYSTTINTRPSLLSTLHGSALTTTSMAGAKSSRSEDEPFQVNVLKGILGLGMKVKVTAEGYSQVTEVQLTGPIAKDKNIRTGDYLLAINNTELTGLQDSKVQQILRLLPRGLAKIIASATPPSGDLRSSDPRRDSKELAIKPEVLDINPRSTKPKTCALLPVQTSGPKDSPGFQGRPGDKNNLEKSSDCFRGDSVNDVGGHFVGGSPVHSNCINLSMQDNVLGSADIAFCVDNSENQRMGDNPDFQENYHDNSEDLHDYDGQSNLLSYYHQIRSESNTTDIKLLNSFDDITNSEYPNVKSRRRWSVAMGSQELNTAYIKGSVNSDITLDESIMSSENLAILLDNANDVMDRTGLSLDDEIVVVILHRPDLMMTIGVRLTVGQHQKAVVSSVDSDSLAGKDGRIVSGDVLLSANGESLTADKMDDVMDKLNKTMSSHIVLVVSKSDLLHTLVSMDTDHPYDQIVPNSRMKVKDDAVPDLGNVVQTDNKVMDEVIDKRSEVIVSKSPPKAPVSKLGLQVTDIELPPPSEITVIDPPPPEVMVIDPPPSEVKVIDPPSSEVTVIDPPTPEVTVIDTSPPEVTLIDQPPLDVTVIDQPPLNVTVIDPSPPEVMVIDQPPPEITVIDPPTPEVTVIDTSPPEVTVIDQPPLDVTVIDPPTPEVTVMDPSPPEVTTSSLIPVVPDAVKNSEVKVHLGTFSFEMPVFDDPVDDQDKEEFDVVMTKGVTGLGFLIEGGKASARGDVPLTIRRILKTGPAVKCGQLMVKDEIREINGEDITGMRHSEAWQHLKFLDDGEVRLKIWRRKRDI